MVPNRVRRLSSAALLSCTPQTGTLYFFRPTILKYCNYCLQRSSDRIQVRYYKQDLLKLIVLRVKPQHNLPSLSASNDVIVNKKKITLARLVSSVCVLALPELLPPFSTLSLTFGSSTSTTRSRWCCLLDSKHHHVMNRRKSSKWVIIKARCHDCTLATLIIFSFSWASNQQKDGHLFSCFELEVNENKLASQPRAASEKEDQG